SFPAFIFCNTRLDYYIAFVVNDHIQFLGRQSKKVTNFVWKTAEVPNVRHRNYQIDMPHTVATYFLLCYFHTTTVANNTFVADSFIFTTGTFVILYRTKNALTEKTVTLWLVRTVVYCFGF